MHHMMIRSRCFYARNEVASLTILDVIHTGGEEKTDKNYLSDPFLASPDYEKMLSLGWTQELTPVGPLVTS